MYANAFEQWEYPPGCPFRASRVYDTYRLLKNAGLLVGADRDIVAPKSATRDAVLALHDASYLDLLDRATRGDLSVEGLAAGLGRPDTPIFADLMQIALAAAGSSLAAAELLLNRKYERIFSPLGGFHHAKRHHAGGFCYLNDIALACAHLARAGRRVLCLDLDAHHGDGTQEIFYRRSDVMTISLHQSGKTLYPWGGFEHETGQDNGRGYNANLCFPEGTFDDVYLRAFHEIVPPLIDVFAPDVIVVELGMDTLAGDPLTQMALTNNAPTQALSWLCSLGLPLLATGGGGYQVAHTARAWARAWEVLCDDDGDHAIGLGGDLLGSSDWRGGWQDPERPIPPELRPRIEALVQSSLDTLKQALFPLHGL